MAFFPVLYPLFISCTMNLSIYSPTWGIKSAEAVLHPKPKTQGNHKKLPKNENCLSKDLIESRPFEIR